MSPVSSHQREQKVINKSKNMLEILSDRPNQESTEDAIILRHSPNKDDIDDGVRVKLEMTKKQINKV